MSDVRPYEIRLREDKVFLYPTGAYYNRPITMTEVIHQREVMADELVNWLRSFRSKSSRPSDKHYFKMLVQRIYELESLMSTGKTAAKKPPQGNSNFKGFLQRPLTDEELIACATAKVKPIQIFERMNSIVLNGFKLSLNTTKDGGSIASWTDITEGRLSFGYCLSTWGEDPYEALMLSVYKHDEVLKGDWNELISRTASRKRG